MPNKPALRTSAFPSVNRRANLFLLRAALTLAKSGVPSRPPRMDSDERLAMQLIARMQACGKKTAFHSTAKR